MTPIVSLLLIGLSLALAVMSAAVIALWVESKRVDRQERALDAAGRTVEQLTAERDEARRALDRVLGEQRGSYLYVRPAPRSADAPTQQFDKIVERSNWPMWPGDEGQSR